MRRVCVFAGSSPGARDGYVEAARDLGRELAARGLELVYGGAKVGLMGAIADAVLESDGRVVGVIPESLVSKEVAHPALTELRVVSTMHERKSAMYDLSDGFIGLPGGLGTVEELFEVTTWSQLGFHAKPIGLLDVEGYFESLLAFLDHTVTERFVRPEHRAILIVGDAPDELLDRFRSYVPPGTDKWMDRTGGATRRSVR